MNDLEHMNDLEARLLRALTSATGVAPEQFGDSAMRSIVREAIQSATNPEDLLSGKGEAWSAMVEAVLVPETWFFRNPEAFSAFASWLQTRPPERPTRVLCVPCATGEEAYSLVITIIDHGFDLANVRFTAGDLSVEALAKARSGIYGRHAFRGASHLMNDTRHFAKLTDGTWKVSDRIRDAVTFHEMNLVGAEALPEADAIFCRNALIYFNRATQDVAFEQLSRALPDDGILFLGPVELPIAQRHGFVGTDYPMAFACHKGPEPGPYKASKAVRAPSRISVGIRKPETNKPVFADWNSGSENSCESLRRAQELADSGRHAEATAALDALIVSDRADADTYCLAAIVREAIGDQDRAEALYRKALFLDPEHTEALLHLALLLESDGRSVAASPLRQRAKRLIDS